MGWVPEHICLSVVEALILWRALQPAAANAAGCMSCPCSGKLTARSRRPTASPQQRPPCRHFSDCSQA